MVIINCKYIDVNCWGFIEVMVVRYRFITNSYIPQESRQQFEFCEILKVKNYYGTCFNELFFLLDLELIFLKRK